MDGMGRCMENVFIERLWRSPKCKAVLATLKSGGHSSVGVDDKIS